ncbi:MAG: transcriptional repressor [Prevotella sp.]|nr:transcriptional repressor [Prevotella sp.]
MDEKRATELLEGHGIRPTANRLLVLKALARADRPVSLGELEERTMTIDKSGIFRTVMLFREQKLVHTIEDTDGVRYELCHAHDATTDDDQHVHFFCERCHRTFCIDNVPVPPVDLPAGYRPTGANYVLKGICPECEEGGFD